MNLDLEPCVRALAVQYDMLPTGGTVLCAVSGGADSMCLLHVLAGLGEKLGFSLAVAHFNHQLRGRESDRDAAFVAGWCAEQHIPFRLGTGDVTAQAAGANLEETARTMRYTFLRQAASDLGASRIATAHNADDNAETMLIHLIRGTGLQGLTGIPPRRGEIVRPLLTVTRSEILAYLAQHGIPHVEDSSNQDLSYTRNFLRQEIMPRLRALNPRLAQRMGESAQSLRLDHTYLTTQAEEVCQKAEPLGEGLTIPVRAIASLPDPIAHRAVRQLLIMLGLREDCTAAHLKAVAALCRAEDSPSGFVCLPHGLRARRIYNGLYLGKFADTPPRLDPVPLCLDGETCPVGSFWHVLCRPVTCPAGAVHSRDHFYLAAELDGPPVVRSRQTGDVLRPPWRPGKSVKKLMIEAKLPVWTRELIPVLADGQGVLAAAEFGPHRDRLAQPGQPAFEVNFLQQETMETAMLRMQQSANPCVSR